MMPVNDHKRPAGFFQERHPVGRALARDNHKAFHILFQEGLHQPQELFRILVRITKEDGVAVLVGHPLQVIVPHIGQNHAQKARAPLPKDACSGVGPIIQPPGHFQNSLFGDLAHAVLLLPVGADAVVHDKGYQGDGNAGFLGYVLDGDVFGHSSKCFICGGPG